MNDAGVKLTAAGLTFMISVWTIVIVGAGYCIAKILAVKSRRSKGNKG
jgi:hypothetical protein